MSAHVHDSTRRCVAGGEEEEEEEKHICILDHEIREVFCIETES